MHLLDRNVRRGYLFTDGVASFTRIRDVNLRLKDNHLSHLSRLLTRDNAREVTKELLLWD